MFNKRIPDQGRNAIRQLDTDSDYSKQFNYYSTLFNFKQYMLIAKTRKYIWLIHSVCTANKQIIKHTYSVLFLDAKHGNLASLFWTNTS
jgi:hypothetical protein